MQKIDVEAFEETGRPEGGHAVVRLLGVSIIPDDLTYRIKLADSAHHGEGRGGWNEGERRPIATRVTALGAELVVGPEVVENPLFLPGMLTVIEVQKCGVRGEFLWPRISPLARPKRRHLRLAVPTPVPEPKVEAVVPTAFELPPVALEVQLQSGGAPSGVSPAIAARNVAATVPGDPHLRPGAEPHGQAGVLIPARAAEQAEPGAGNPVRELTRVLADRPAAASTPVWRKQNGPRPAFGLPHLFAAALAGGVLAAVAGLFVESGSAPRQQRFAPVAIQAAAPARPAVNADVLAELFTTGAKSPRGRDVKKMSADEILTAANDHLHGAETLRDKREVAFLLSSYLGTTLSQERTLWALTQLGSNYAEPDAARGQKPDYEKARQLWSIAGALGDPVALCFLGSLHEYALGTLLDRAAASAWYARAKAAGGCPGLDAALARTRS